MEKGRLAEDLLEKKQSLTKRKTLKLFKRKSLQYPVGSMYGIFTYIYHINQLNVGEHTIHEWCGILQGNLSKTTVRQKTSPATSPQSN